MDRWEPSKREEWLTIKKDDTRKGGKVHVGLSLKKDATKSRCVCVGNCDENVE